MGCSNSKSKKSNKKGKDLKIRDVERNANNINNKEAKIYEIKICLLGDVAVGKTSIASRFCKNVFNESYVNTIGGAYQQQTILLDNDIKMKLHVWDTSGDERFKSMTNLYYRDAQVAILTYDITNSQSFEGLNFWLKELNDKVNKDNMLLFLVGNKCDVDNNMKRVSSKEAKEFAEQNNMFFFETSAKTGTGIKELFKTIATKEYELLKK
jgi:Ras-related protein Rab-5C